MVKKKKKNNSSLFKLVTLQFCKVKILLTGNDVQIKNVFNQYQNIFGQNGWAQCDKVLMSI